MRKEYIIIFLTVIVIAIIIIGGNIFSKKYFDQKDIVIARENIENNKPIIETSIQNIEKEMEFILREKNGYIAIYVIDEDGNEYLREITTILTKYLPEFDKIKLKEGIKVVGKEQLNKLLEDYE